MGLTRCRRNGKWRTSARRGYYRYRFVAARPIPGSGHDGRDCLLFPLSQRGCRLRPEDYSEIVAAGWSWASGGIVSTPSDLNEFIRGYVGGELFDRRTRAQQRRVLEGGSSEPPGPGYNSAGLAVFRYQTKCGTVWGHTGNTPGYTQFMAASPDGSRSVVASVNEQLTPIAGAPGAFDALRRAEGKAVCAALADR
jgi:D-alanyl-D-alanine carboxypeptidase